MSDSEIIKTLELVQKLIDPLPVSGAGDRNALSAAMANIEKVKVELKKRKPEASKPEEK
jgi:hypothetical protein